MGELVQGYCPMGCGQTLFLGESGYVTCSQVKCPRPDAVSKLLDDRETEHVIECKPAGFTIKHPLRERVDDALMACTLLAYVQRSGVPASGTYRVRCASAGKPERWTLQAIVPAESAP